MSNKKGAVQKFKSFNSEIKDRIDYSKNYKNPKKYFCTHPHYKHSSNCPNRFENIVNAASKYGENLYVKLGDEQKRRILFDTHQKAAGQAGEVWA